MADGKSGAVEPTWGPGRLLQVAKRCELTPTAVLTLLVGAAGVFLGLRCHVPGGAMTGALGATAAVRLLGGPLHEPPRWLRTFARTVLGLSIGATVTVETLHSITRALMPVSIIVLAMVGIGLLTARAINRYTGMPLPTALCASTPGVLTAMIALAEDLGGDGRVVASMHLVRMVSILLFVPAFVHVVFAGTTPLQPAAAAPAAAGASLHLVILLVAGLLAGLLAVRLKLPGGDLLAGLVVAALANPAWLHLTHLPASWQLFAQWIVGAGVGATVTRAVLKDFHPFALAGGLMTVFLIGSALGLGWALAQLTSLDLATCIVGSAPGGAETMVILAGELGADAQLVAAMHIARQIILMLLLPVLARVAAAGKPAY